MYSNKKTLNSKLLFFLFLTSYNNQVFSTTERINDVFYTMGEINDVFYTMGEINGTQQVNNSKIKEEVGKINNQEENNEYNNSKNKVNEKSEVKKIFFFYFLIFIFLIVLLLSTYFNLIQIEPIMEKNSKYNNTLINKEDYILNKLTLKQEIAYHIVISAIILLSLIYIYYKTYYKNNEKNIMKTEELKQKELENITLNKEDIQDNRTEEVIVTQETKSNSKESIVIVSSLALLLGLIRIVLSFVFKSKNNIESTKVII